MTYEQLELNGCYAMLCEALRAWYRIQHDHIREIAAKTLKDVYGFESHRRHFRKPGLDAGFPCFSNGFRVVCNSLQITANHVNYRRSVGKMWARNCCWVDVR